MCDPSFSSSPVCKRELWRHYLCSHICWLPVLYCTTCYAEKHHHSEIRKCYYCFILKDQLKNFSNFSVTYSLLLKCPGFLCVFSTPCTKAVDGYDQGAFSENMGKGQQDCTGTLSARTGNSCFSLCFISPTTFFQ